MLRILHLTQTPTDADHVHRALVAEGFACEERVVNNRSEFIACLELEPFDLILSDYRPPGFGGLPALELSLKSHPEVPFLFVSDSIGDERSVETLKRGARDFVLKGNSERLVFAVQRALKEAAAGTPQQQRWRLSEELQINGDRFERAARALCDMVWDWNIATEQVWFSDRFKHFGYPLLKEAFSIELWFDRIHPQHRPRIKDSIDAFLAGSESLWSGGYLFRRHDGSYAFIEDHAYAQRDDDGCAVRMVGLMTDVTDRKLMEKSLRESRQHFAAFMDNLPGFAWMKDLQGRYVYVNKRMEDLPEYRNGWRGKTDADLWPSEMAAQYAANDRRAIVQEESVQNIEPCLLNGEQGFVLANKFAIRDDSGEVIMVGGSAVDVTELKRSESLLKKLSADVLRTQEAERKRVARELHDGVSQTLSQVKARIHALMPKSPAQRREAVEVQSLLAKTLEEVRRISHNLLPSELEDLGLVPTVRSLCSDFERRTSIVVNLEHSDIPDDLPDDLRLALFRIIQEAMNNVEKHAQARTIDLRLQAVDNGVEVVVRDDGVGFHPALLRSQGIRDSRMGLSNMRERALSVGGTLDIVSLPNRGTTIQLHVPLKAQFNYRQHQS